MNSSLTMLAHRNVLLIWVSWAITRWNILLNVNIFLLTGDSIQTSNMAIIRNHPSRFANKLLISTQFFLLIIFTLVSIILSLHHNFVLSATFENSLGTSHEHILFADVVWGNVELVFWFGSREHLCHNLMILKFILPGKLSLVRLYFSVTSCIRKDGPIRIDPNSDLLLLVLLFFSVSTVVIYLGKLIVWWNVRKLRLWRNMWQRSIAGVNPMNLTRFAIWLWVLGLLWIFDDVTLRIIKKVVIFVIVSLLWYLSIIIFFNRSFHAGICCSIFFAHHISVTRVSFFDHRCFTVLIFVLNIFETGFLLWWAARHVTSIILFLFDLHNLNFFVVLGWSTLNCQIDLLELLIWSLRLHSAILNFPLSGYGILGRENIISYFRMPVNSLFI